MNIDMISDIEIGDHLVSPNPQLADLIVDSIIDTKEFIVVTKLDDMGNPGSQTTISFDAIPYNNYRSLRSIRKEKLNNILK